ncbi:prepilin-type N-terminal cleavage/methylation domain-containing protein [Thalassotalea fonticola]|uniref:Prepilin-type N-terminal cleavage/methylation domain-containing protein n=1 Tax=Thalassotalea fonticola TaxID=3065649 RepID=A0ABZ0GJ99_9GAMM|nr:prepilin-type N-terminal cleavage/methylation domain-containing protein [Colwelliaceae bacterium S1-1]
MKTSTGFTLIELTLVIAILGIISVGFIGVINIGSNVYSNVSSRDTLISSSRFAVERLNREIRNALPNSIRIAALGDRQCVEFVPIVASTIYTQAPIFPDAAQTSISVIQFGNGYLGDDDDFVVIYPLNSNDAYDPSLQKRAGLKSIDTSVSNIWQLELDSAAQFSEESPTERLFIISLPVSYCVAQNRLIRYQNYGFNITQDLLSTANGVLMAEFLNVDEGLPFTYQEDVQMRNAVVQIDFKFSQNNESVYFSNGVHINNVP